MELWNKRVANQKKYIFGRLWSIATATFFIILLSSGFGPARAADAKDIQLDVWKSPSCGCCSKWVDYMVSRNYIVKSNNVPHGILAKIKMEAGIAPHLASCHTAKISGYVIEGHVPAEDVERLLRERPVAIGLTVPGMPIGSPGMEFGNKREPYEVMLIRKDGTVEIFSRKAQEN